MKRASSRCFALLDGSEEVFGQLVPHPLETHEVVPRQVIEVGHVIHQAEPQELLDVLLPQPVDVHGAARGEMDDRLADLRRAGEPHAADRHFTGDLHHLGAALRTVRRNRERLLHCLCACRSGPSPPPG